MNVIEQVLQLRKLTWPKRNELIAHWLLVWVAMGCQ
ncbi:MAG: preprotein translocase subunit SecE [Planctomycetota bacterium]|jgi:preprotein translocase subunit SecE